MRIGELAQKTHCDVQTIRFYEKKGLIPEPGRTPAGYRIYQHKHLEQLKFVRHCRSLDISLADIKLLLVYQQNPDSTCNRVNYLLDYQINQVDKRLASFSRLKKQLQALRRTCSEPQPTAECGILRTLTESVEDAACACHNL